MGIIKSQPTNGAELEKRAKKEIKEAFRVSTTLLDAVRIGLEAVIAQARNERYNREAVIRGLESIREKALPKIRGKLSELINLLEGYIPRGDVVKAAEILRIQWDKDIMNLLFEVKNNRYTQGPKSDELRQREETAKRRGTILRALRLFVKEEGARSVDELRNKLEKSRREIIKALELVVEASKFF